jgi:hypothetical protein
MTEDVIEFPEHGDAAGSAEAADEAGHADGADGDVAAPPETPDHFLIDDTLAFIHLKLTALPNNEIKIDMAKECVDENLTTRQLGYRIRRRVAEMAPAREEPGAEGEGDAPTPDREPDPAADAANAFIADLDQLTRQATALNPEPLEPHLDNLHPEIRGSQEYRLTTVSHALEATRIMCKHLLHRLRPGESEH